LNLIENPGPHPTVALHQKTFEYRGGSWFSLGAWRGRIFFFRDRAKRALSSRKPRPLNVKRIKAVFLICAFVLTSFFIRYWIVSLMDLRKLSNIEMGVNRQDGFSSLPQIPEAPEALLLKQPLSWYLEKSRQKNIFKMGPPAPRLEAPSIEAPSFSIGEAIKHLKLVGISWSGDPYAMIEDTTASRTFFVKTGETVGAIKVKAIFKDKVILSHEGQEIELR